MLARGACLAGRQAGRAAWRCLWNLLNVGLLRAAAPVASLPRCLGPGLPRPFPAGEKGVVPLSVWERVQGEGDAT